ncbi:MAG: HD domain-containing protein [Phycisphaerae bacterium]
MSHAKLIRRILSDYKLRPDGLHGLGHWARVLSIARRLAEQTGVRRDVLECFALFHDARRFGEGHDPGHGPRAAIYVCELGPRALGLDAEGLDLLQRACHGHTEGRTSDEPTIGACWDADRLDLPRAGIHADPHLLSTPAARHVELIEWARGRSCAGTIPDMISKEWGIDNLPGPGHAAE